MFKGELEGDLEGDLKGYLKEDLEGDFEVDLEVDLEGDFRGDFKQDLERGLAVKHRSVKVQVRSGPGWFSIELKFNSFELDSKVGRLVNIYSLYHIFLMRFSLLTEFYKLNFSKHLFC